MLSNNDHDQAIFGRNVCGICDCDAESLASISEIGEMCEKAYLARCFVKVVTLFEKHQLQLPVHQLKLYKDGELDRIIEANNKG
jgi:hypothetical protein